MPKRLLITEADVAAAAREGRTALTLPPGSLVTPLARDAARDRGVALVFAALSSSPAPASPGASPAPSGPVAPATKTVAIGSDHGGFAYKSDLKPLIESLGWKVLDVGTDSEESCDYPDFAFAVARGVALGRADFGVMLDGAGIGSAMVCNKVPGVRAACAYNEFTAWNARAHNDATVLTLGSRTLGIEVCRRIVRVFLETAFEGGRHAARVEKIADVEARFLPGEVR